MLYAMLTMFALFAWTITYFFVIRPKLVEFKLTAGIYAKIDAFEGSIWQKIDLHLKGAKVAIGGFIASMIPIVGGALDSLNGVNWPALFPTKMAATIGAVVGFAAAMAPLVMVVLHMTGMAEAARIVPHADEPAPIPAAAPVPVAAAAPAPGPAPAAEAAPAVEAPLAPAPAPVTPATA